MKFLRLSRYRTGGTTSNMQLSLPVPHTPDGRVYRFSPNEDAHARHFVIGNVTALQIPDGRVSKSYGTKFTVPFFHMLAEDRMRMKRFVANLKG